MDNAIKKRDRLMIFVIIALALFSFEALFPSTTSQVLKEVLGFKFGLTFQPNLSLIGSTVWFLLLIFILRYFQVAIFIERQYKYLHKIEDRINQEMNDELITREGKGYLAKYPAFSNWIWALYTIIFPSILFVITTIKIRYEWLSVQFSNPLAIYLNTTVYVLITISIILYLDMLHFKPKRKA